MNETLKLLYDRFYIPLPMVESEQEVETCHRQLIERLDKPERKLVLYEIMKTFNLVAETVGASEAIIGIKKSYVQTVKALQQHIEEFPRIRIHLLEEVYPMGDEVVLIYEATGRVVRPGGLPIEQGVIVFNVETIYNVWAL